jgi:hypothetical protein
MLRGQERLRGTFSASKVFSEGAPSDPRAGPLLRGGNSIKLDELVRRDRNADG